MRGTTEYAVYSAGGVARGKELALELEQKGYSWLDQEAAQPVGA